MLQNPTPRLVLASASIARRMLLADAGLAFTVQPAAIDEAAARRAARDRRESAGQAALGLAVLKARSVAMVSPDAVVIGADQILVCDDEWFDKPADLVQARRQLQTLRARTHTLVSAVVCQRGEQPLWQHVARPVLAMRDFSDRFLDDYLAVEGEQALSSVGGYRLEGPGIHLFDRIDGEHSAILGLPLLPLLGFLRHCGVAGS